LICFVAQLFPGSDWVAGNAALAHYNMRNFDEAQALYEDLLARDPARLAVSVVLSVVDGVQQRAMPHPTSAWQPHSLSRQQTCLLLQCYVHGMRVSKQSVACCILCSALAAGILLPSTNV
jgi:anaphase-promoting complex subunit 8